MANVDSEVTVLELGEDMSMFSEVEQATSRQAKNEF